MTGTVSPTAVPPLPAPLPPWAKALLWLAETVAQGLLLNQYEYAASTTPLETTWRRFAFRWVDTYSLDSADDQILTLDIANITGGNIDSTWTEQDYSDVTAALSDWTLSLNAAVSSRMTHDQVAAYVMGFRPYSDPKPLAESGAPERVFPRAQTGQSLPNSAPQVSSTITEVTAARSHWGRMYLPSIGSGAIGSNGRLMPANQSALLAATQTLYQTLMGAEFFPVVVTTMSNKAPLRALQTVNAVRIDDVLDIQRSRRHHKPLSVSEAPVASATLPAAETAA